MYCVLICIMCHIGHTTCYIWEIKDSPVCLKLTVNIQWAATMSHCTSNQVQHTIYNTFKTTMTKSINKQNPLELNEAESIKIKWTTKTYISYLICYLSSKCHPCTWREERDREVSALDFVCVRHPEVNTVLILGLWHQSREAVKFPREKSVLFRAALRYSKDHLVRVPLSTLCLHLCLLWSCIFKWSFCQSTCVCCVCVCASKSDYRLLMALTNYADNPDKRLSWQPQKTQNPQHVPVLNYTCSIVWAESASHSDHDLFISEKCQSGANL